MSQAGVRALTIIGALAGVAISIVLLHPGFKAAPFLCPLSAAAGAVLGRFIAKAGADDTMEWWDW